MRRWLFLVFFTLLFTRRTQTMRGVLHTDIFYGFIRPLIVLSWEIVFLKKKTFLFFFVQQISAASADPEPGD